MQALFEQGFPPGLALNYEVRTAGGGMHMTHGYQVGTYAIRYAPGTSFRAVNSGQTTWSDAYVVDCWTAKLSIFPAKTLEHAFLVADDVSRFFSYEGQSVEELCQILEPTRPWLVYLRALKDPSKAVGWRRWRRRKKKSVAITNYAP